MSRRWLPSVTKSIKTPSNVFVLCTGRCGSVTFATACGHLSNFTAGHETRSGKIGKARMAYPKGHIEADNRLSWHLALLGQRWDKDGAFYVHLKRDPDAVARSYARRWNGKYRASMIRAFGHGIVMRAKDWPEEKRVDVARFYADTVNANIEEFLKNRPSMTVDLETIETDFPVFLDRIGAEGDLDAAIGEWSVRHNASKTPSEISPSSE
ncbi:MAG: hypothetical protein L0H31_03070 [Nocardioidaceae bacterium]|nr:hypothetical protein [Nocardioidaceae bacterium]